MASEKNGVPEFAQDCHFWCSVRAIHCRSYKAATALLSLHFFELFCTLNTQFTIGTGECNDTLEVFNGLLFCI